MRIKVNKIILGILIVFAFGSLAPSYSFASSNDERMVELNNLLETIYTQIENNGEAETETVNQLESLINEFGVDTDVIGEAIIEEDNINIDTEIPQNSGMISVMGFNEWHDIGKGWKMTVHRPHGSNATKYHTHVKGKVNGKTVEAKEALDGSSTHGKGNTMNEKKVPKKIQDEVRKHKDFKKAKAEEADAKKAKKQMNAKKLDMKKATDVVIAIGIFVAVVGIMLFVPTSIAAWAAVFMAISV